VPGAQLLIEWVLKGGCPEAVTRANDDHLV